MHDAHSLIIRVFSILSSRGSDSRPLSRNRRSMNIEFHRGDVITLRRFPMSGAEITTSSSTEMCNICSSLAQPLRPGLRGGHIKKRPNSWFCKLMYLCKHFQKFNKGMLIKVNLTNLCKNLVKKCLNTEAN